MKPTTLVLKERALVLTNPAEFYALIDFPEFMSERAGVKRDEVLAGAKDNCLCEADDCARYL